MTLESIRDIVKGTIGTDRYERFKVREHVRSYGLLVLRSLYRRDLESLARLYGTDKWRGHDYARHYQSNFEALRTSKIRLLEIGVGGYDDPLAGGASLRMWKAFFPKAEIYAIDIHDKSAIEEPGIKIFRGSQADPDFLRWVVHQIGGFEIIIDDGSHVNQHVILSFATLFPYLSSNGIYAIEDLETAYRPEYGGSKDLQSSETSVALCKQLIDGLNWREFIPQSSTVFDKELAALHFYNSLVLIQKQ